MVSFFNNLWLEFELANKSRRFWILALAMAALFARLTIFLISCFQDLNFTLLNTSDRLKAHWLVNIDFLFWLYVGIFFLIPLMLFQTRSSKWEKPASVFYLKPLNSFSIFFIIAFFFMVYFPILITYGIGLRGIEGTGFRQFLPHMLGYDLYKLPGGDSLSYFLSDFLPNFKYLKSMLFLSLGFGIFFSEFHSKSKKPPWWSLSYLLFPMPFLWWITFSALLPSKSWKWWRHILFCASFILPGMAFLSSQPIVKAYPELAPYHEKVGSFNQYQIVPLPGEKAFIAGWYNELALGEKTEAHWETRTVDINLEADEGAYDFENNLAYVLEGHNRTLRIFDIPSFSERNKIEIPQEGFPAQGEFIRQAIDPGRGILVFSHKERILMTMDQKTLKIRNTIHMDNLKGYIWRLFVNKEKGELFVLESGSILVFNLEDLKLKRWASLPGKAFDMAFDKRRNRLFIPLPAGMEVIVINPATLAIMERIPAAVGVRTVALDQKRGLIYFGSISGALETRQMDGYKIILTERVIPWIRRIAVLPQTGDVIVTDRGLPVIISHNGEKGGFDPALALMNLAAKSAGRFVESQTFQTTFSQDSNPLYNSPAGKGIQ